MTNNRCQRHRNIDAIARSTIHQSLATPSSQIAMARSKSSTLNDPKQALDLIRSLIQTELNEKIQFIMQEYVDTLFQPAIQNIRKNLQMDDNLIHSSLLLEEVCCSALDHAKLVFKSQSQRGVSNNSGDCQQGGTHPGGASGGAGSASLATRMAVKRKLSLQSMIAHSNSRAKKRALQHQMCSKSADLALVTAEGKPVRREGPKWDAKRINQETLFVLGVKACRLLGYKRGSRLYSTHPTLFKYTLDSEDKHRLVESNVIPLNSLGKKVNVLVVEDIIEIAENMQSSIETEEILRHSFKCPPGMIDKMKIFIDLVKTDPSESDEMLLKKVAPSSGNSANQASSANNSNVHDLINSTEMKSEPDEPTGVSEEDLGFLQNMNLTSLVREFEMEAAAASGEGGAQHLGILSLADDVDTENPFSELEDHDHHEQSNGNMTDSLNDIGFE